MLATEGPARMNVDSLGELSVLGGSVVGKLESVDGQKEHLFVEGHTKVTSGAARRRGDELTQSISEYEIPFDPQWELPRDRSVSLQQIF